MGLLCEVSAKKRLFPVVDSTASRWLRMYLGKRYFEMTHLTPRGNYIFQNNITDGNNTFTVRTGPYWWRQPSLLSLGY
jgi:hypothetical protein